MKQLYVIIESGGQYEAAWEHARFVTDDREKAEHDNIFELSKVTVV